MGNSNTRIRLGLSNGSDFPPQTAESQNFLWYQENSYGLESLPVNVRDIDPHHKAGAYDYRVSLLFLEVICPVGEDLTGLRIAGEVLRIGAP